jgi:hypothetical protein
MIKFDEYGYIEGYGETLYPFCWECNAWIYNCDFIIEGIWVIFQWCHTCNTFKAKVIK